MLLSDGSILMVQEIQRTEAYGRVAIISVSRSAAGRQSTTAEGFTYNRQEEEIIILSLLL